MVWNLCDLWLLHIERGVLSGAYFFTEALFEYAVRPDPDGCSEPRSNEVERSLTHVFRPSPDKRGSRKLAHDQNSDLAHYPRLFVPKETPGATKAREARAPQASKS